MDSTFKHTRPDGTTVTVPLGTVSEGTLRPEDLIVAFMGVLADVAHPRYREFLDAWFEHAPDDEAASALVDELIDTLDEIAPPHIYFGAHWGDAADFGFWPVECEKCGDSATVSDDEGRPLCASCAANSACEACKGKGWLVMAPDCLGGEYLAVERCDLCAVFEDDEAAARAAPLMCEERTCQNGGTHFVVREVSDA